MKFKLLLAVAALTVTLQTNAFNLNKHSSNAKLSNNLPEKLQKIEICQDFPICKYIESRQTIRGLNALEKANALPVFNKVKLTPGIQKNNII